MKVRKGIDMVCIGLIAISSILLLFLFNYCDCHSLTTWSFDFWDCLFNVKLLSYHEYLNENVRMAYHGSSLGSFSWLMIFPLILWNLPAWLANILFIHNQVLEPGFMVWTKIGLLLCAMIVIVVIYKVSEEMTLSEVSILMLGSVEVMISVIYFGQDEIVYLALFFVGLYYLKKENYRFFYVWSFVSCVLCPIMILPLFLCVCTYEKRVWIILVETIAPLLPSVLYSMIYKSHGYVTTSPLVWVEDIFWGLYVDTAMNALSVVGVLCVLICGYGYFRVDLRQNEFEYEYSRCITLLALLMTTVFLFGNHQTYRRFLYLPFILLMIGLEKEKTKRETMVILLMMAEGIRAFYIISNATSIMSTEWLWDNALTELIAPNGFATATDLYSWLIQWNEHIKGLFILFNPVVIGCLLLLYYVRVTKKHTELKWPYGKELLKVLYSCAMFVVIVMFVVLLQQH